jgi:hypothetical protein
MRRVLHSFQLRMTRETKSDVKYENGPPLAATNAMARHVSEALSFKLRRRHRRGISATPREASSDPFCYVVYRRGSVAGAAKIVNGHANRDLTLWRSPSTAITIESSRPLRPRRFHAATFLLPLPRRFHERKFGLKSAQQKALENCAFSRAC